MTEHRRIFNISIALSLGRIISVIHYTDKASRGKGLIRFRVGNNNLDGDNNDVGVL